MCWLNMSCILLGVLLSLFVFEVRKGLVKSDWREIRCIFGGSRRPTICEFYSISHPKID